MDQNEKQIPAITLGYVPDNPYSISSMDGKYEVSCMSMESIPTIEISYGVTKTTQNCMGYEENDNYTSTYSGTGSCPNTWTLTGNPITDFLGYGRSDNYYIKDPNGNGLDILYLNDFQIIIIENKIDSTKDAYFFITISSYNEQFTDVEKDFYKTHKLVIMLDDETGKINELELNPLNSFDNFKQYQFLYNGTIDDNAITKDVSKNDCMIFMAKFSGQSEIDQIMKDNYLVNDILSVVINQPERTYGATYGFEYREL